MTYKNIQAALDGRVSSGTGLPALQLENTKNIAQSGVPFMRATFLPARSSQLTVGVDGKDLRLGLYQVDVFVPLNQGTSLANEYADVVMSLFPRGVITQSGTDVHISSVWREAGRRVESFYQVPVMVRWSAISS